MTHALSCSIGGLVIAHHKKIHEELLYLSQRAFTSSYVRAKPIIYQGRTRSELVIRQGSDKHKDTRGEVMIQGLWDHQVNAIVDVKLRYSGVDMYKYEPMPKLLYKWENIKKDKHSKNCHHKRKLFRRLFFQWTEL